MTERETPGRKEKPQGLGTGGIMPNFSGDRRCRICNAVISDDNPDGIGMQCRAVFKKARWMVFAEDQDRKAGYYRPVNDVIMGEFERIFSKVNFRSAFRKDFYPSVVEQYKTKGFLTRKQVGIIRGMLCERDPYHWNRADHDNPLLKEARAKRSEIYQNWLPSVEEHEHINNLANKLRHN